MGLTDLRAPAAAAVAAREPAGPRVVQFLRAGWRWLCGVVERIENSWMGDLIGVICLSVLLVMLVFLGAALE